MKKLALILIVLIATGCTQRTDKGPCIGVMDQADPKLEYELSYWNIFVAAVFSETIIIPLYTVAKDVQCPYKVK